MNARGMAALAAAAALCLAPSVAGAKGAVHTVVIDGVAYSPASIDVKRGDTVVWVNRDPFPHTVTSANAFDSKDIPAGGKWKYVPRAAGTFDYTCAYHPNMKGRLKVE